jgi:hypothetical protein
MNMSVASAVAKPKTQNPGDERECDLLESFHDIHLLIEDAGRPKQRQTAKKDSKREEKQLIDSEKK